VFRPFVFGVEFVHVKLAPFKSPFVQEGGYLLGVKTSQTDQVVGSKRQRKGGIHTLSTPQLHLGQTGRTLDPANTS